MEFIRTGGPEGYREAFFKRNLCLDVAIGDD
jgi:hypothetical protein